MPPRNYEPPVIEILPSSCSRPSTSSSSSHDPFTAITSDDTPKDKSVPPVTEILPSSCSRPIASSSSSYDPSSAITDHTLGDKDHHLTQTPGQETDNATSRTPTYKGIPLTIADVVNRFPEIRSFSAKKCGRTRAHILCTTCQEYEEMAKKSSKNGTIAIASGVRENCSDRLERVIDHMTSEPHIAATNKKKMDEAW